MDLIAEEKEKLKIDQYKIVQSEEQIRNTNKKTKSQIHLRQYKRSKIFLIEEVKQKDIEAKKNI